jgi:5-methylcytosine-specific restriction protein A
VEARKWYYTTAWQTLRALVLAEQPVCVLCHVAPSTEVDHIAPHRGHYALFFNRHNLQGLCATCHGRKTRQGL